MPWQRDGTSMQTAARHSLMGKAWGLGGRERGVALSWVRTRLPPGDLEDCIPPWITWGGPRESPGLRRHLPNGCPQGTQEPSSAQRRGAGMGRRARGGKEAMPGDLAAKR